MLLVRRRTVRVQAPPPLKGTHSQSLAKGTSLRVLSPPERANEVSFPATLGLAARNCFGHVHTIIDDNLLITTRIVIGGVFKGKSQSD